MEYIVAGDRENCESDALEDFVATGSIDYQSAVRTNAMANLPC